MAASRDALAKRALRIVNKRLLRTIAKAHGDRVLPASDHDLSWGRQKDQRVTIKGLRVFARKNGAVHVQVFAGTKWLSILTIPWLIDKNGCNSSATARYIKSHIRGEGIRS